MKIIGFALSVADRQPLEEIQVQKELQDLVRKHKKSFHPFFEGPGNFWGFQ